MTNIQKYQGVIPAFYACYDECGEVSEAGVRELTEYFSSLSRFKYSITQIRIINSPDSPFFTVIERAK